MKNSVAFLVGVTILVTTPHSGDALVTTRTATGCRHCPSSSSSSSSFRQTTELSMIGGRGWNNDDYLNGLTGDDDDREKATEEYKEYSKNREAFLNRQREAMKTPQGRAFLEARTASLQQQQQQNGDGNMDSLSIPQDSVWDNVKPGSGGGSRMGQMMARAEQMKKMGRPMNSMMMGDFEQRLAIPLDDDDDEDETEN